MNADDRAAREEKVIEQIREWLPELGQVGPITIRAVDPDENDGALFLVERPNVFACRRGGGR